MRGWSGARVHPCMADCSRRRQKADSQASSPGWQAYGSKASRFREVLKNNPHELQTQLWALQPRHQLQPQTKVRQPACMLRFALHALSATAEKSWHGPACAGMLHREQISQRHLHAAGVAPGYAAQQGGPSVVSFAAHPGAMQCLYVPCNAFNLVSQMHAMKHLDGHA